jgi:serine/threonine protein phosphatase PrpC
MITANPDVTKFKNENMDFAIIGCDGIWEKKSCEEMVGWVAERIDKKGLG